MATMTTHAPGTFCWPELATSDYAGAKRFYTALFGWTVNERDMGGGEMYAMLKLNGLDACALYKMRKEEASQGVPPHWNSYVSVTSADEAAAKAKQLGATVIMDPFDVFDVGRMAAIKDPTGAVFFVWQAKKHAGVGVLDEPGSLCWTELMTRDTAKAGKFYTQLIGWGSEEMPVGPMKYTIFKRGDKQAGGMMAITPDMGPLPSHWLVYFAAKDCDASTKKATGLGAKAVVPPRDIPNIGRFSVLEDPQGAHFALFTPKSSA